MWSSWTGGEVTGSCSRILSLPALTNLPDLPSFHHPSHVGETLVPEEIKRYVSGSYVLSLSWNLDPAPWLHHCFFLSSCGKNWGSESSGGKLLGSSVVSTQKRSWRVNKPVNPIVPVLPATKVKLREVCGKVCLSVAVISWNLLLSICRALRFVVIWYLLDTVNDLQRIIAASPHLKMFPIFPFWPTLTQNMYYYFLTALVSAFSLCIPSLNLPFETQWRSRKLKLFPYKHEMMNMEGFCK